MTVSERAKERLDEAGQEIREAVDGLKQEVADLSNRLKERLKGRGEELRDSTDALTREVKRLSDRVKDLVPGRRKHALPVETEGTAGRLPAFWDPWGDWMTEGFTGAPFRADLKETEEEIRLTADLPGVKKDDLTVSVSHGMVTVRGEKKAENEHQERGFYRLERSYGSFQRSFRLPETVVPDRAEASFRNGVLTVRLPKSEDARRRFRRIPIRSG